MDEETARETKAPIRLGVLLAALGLFLYDEHRGLLRDRDEE
jgi:hypothetical protein